MNQDHLTHEELLAQIYGVGGIEAHVRDCADCSARLQTMELRRQDSAALPEVSNSYLAQQRRSIYARIEDGVSTQARWAPALAAAFLLAIGIALYHPHASMRPASTQASVSAESTTEQLFSDLYSMEQSVEPEAAAPIHELFETSGTDQ